MEAYQSYRQHDFGINEMISYAKANLDAEHARMPWSYTDHGRAIISYEQQLYAYMAAYGEMHKYKCLAALQNTPFETLPFNLEIVDWGCGQGIASVCIIEALRERNLLDRVRKVTLIEPSRLALSVAEQNVRQSLGRYNVQIVAICKYLPSDTDSSQSLEDISFNSPGVLHLFSNVLDITSISLSKTAELITRSSKHHYIYTIAPLNNNSSRLDEFCSYFINSNCFSSIKEPKYGYTSDTQHMFSCKTKCIDFISSGSVSFNEDIEPQTYSEKDTYDDYDRMAYVKNGLLSERFINIYENILKHIYPDDKVYIKPDINGDRPDLAILRKDAGLLIINIFENNINDFQMNESVICKKDEDLDESQIASPISRSFGFIDSFHSFHLKAVPIKNVKDKKAYYLIKSVYIFPQNTTNEIENSIHLKKKRNISNVKCIGKELLTINEVKDYWNLLDFTYNRSADDEIFEEFASLLRTQWHSCTEGINVNLSKEQRDLIKSEPVLKKINGIAGSGKTHVLVSRAVEANKRTGQKVLILTFNITLISYIKYRLQNLPMDFFWDNFEILNYHTFFKMQARNYGLQIQGIDSYDNADFFKEAPINRYSAIFIDEVQDYKEDWLYCIKNYFLADDGELVLFGDLKQNIYHREFDSEAREIKTPIRGRWINRLNKGFRYCNKLFSELAIEFQKEYFSNLIIDKVDSDLYTNTESLFKYFPQYVTLESLYGNWLWLKDQYHLEIKDTVILSETYSVLRGFEKSFRSDARNVNTPSPEITFETIEERAELKKDSSNFEFRLENLRRVKKVHFTMNAPTLKLSSIHSFKGWEADNVILILENPQNTVNEDGYKEKVDNSAELIYTAITRAKKKLIIINLGDDRYNNFFNRFQHGIRIFWSDDVS